MTAPEGKTVADVLTAANMAQLDEVQATLKPAKRAARCARWCRRWRSCNGATR